MKIRTILAFLGAASVVAAPAGAQFGNLGKVIDKAAAPLSGFDVLGRRRAAARRRDQREDS